MGNTSAQPAAPTPKPPQYHANHPRTDGEVLLDRLSDLVLAAGGDRDSAFYCQQLGVERSDLENLFHASIKRNEMLIDEERHIEAAILSKWDRRREWLLTCAHGDDDALLALVMERERNGE